MDPQEGTQFKDVTRLFHEASQQMDIDELLMVEGFTLYEAMSAVEIGDPRMDSGASLPSDCPPQPEFDPLTPLLPEEVCWILDRSMACEMHWHAGNALAQTVYTCLYMHRPATIEHGSIPRDAKAKFEERGLPIQLVSLVVRAGIMGMVKCCDLAYRELVKGNVHDCEDWQGEKSDTSLLESISPQRVLVLLEEAERWLTREENRNLPFRTELLYRIRLRGTLLRLFSLEMPRKMPFVVPLLVEARQLLTSIKQHQHQQSIPQPSSGSPAHVAFDPRITRRLHSVMPMRPLTIPAQSETWKAVEGLLDGWEMVYQLSSCENLLAWNTVGLLRASSVRWATSRPPFIRSLTQTIFSDGSTILDKFAVSWLVEHFFLELAHVSFVHLVSLFEPTSIGAPTSSPNPNPSTGPPGHDLRRTSYSFEEFHSLLTRLIVQHIWASYHNRPRQRRHSMKTVVDWHELYDAALTMTARTKPRDLADSRVLKCIPLVILHWRASIARDIILSGFELELYVPDERPFAYWYLAEVLSENEGVLRELLGAVPEDTPAHNHLLVQAQYIGLLKEMSLGCFTILSGPSKFDAARRWTNFTVRYKWALRGKYQEIATPDPLMPDYRKYLKQEKEVVLMDQNEQRQKAQRLFDSALLRLLQIGTLADKDAALQLCRTEFTQYHLAGLMLVCENLREHLSLSPSCTSTTSALASTHTTMNANATTNATRQPPPLDKTNFTWDLEICPWFPKIEFSSSSLER